RRINAHAKDPGARLDLAPVIADIACLRGASWCIVFRIEIENQRGSAKIRQRHFESGGIFAADGSGMKIWCGIAYFKFGDHDDGNSSGGATMFSRWRDLKPRPPAP